jgi:hypothetical protein
MGLLVPATKRRDVGERSGSQLDAQLGEMGAPALIGKRDWTAAWIAASGGGQCLIA